MTSISDLSTAQLKQILSIKEQIQALTTELSTIAGTPPETPATVVEKTPKKRRMSAAGKAAIAAGAKARRAKIKGTSPTSEPAEKVKRKLSPAHKRKLVEALAKARKIRAAKLKVAKVTRNPTKEDKRRSPEVRAKLAAAAKARWAKAKAEGKKTL